VNLRCNGCGWFVPAGLFIECNVSPALMATLPAEWIVGYMEAEHFLETGCRGSVERFEWPKNYPGGIFQGHFQMVFKNRPI